MMVRGPLRGHLTMRVGNPALPYCGPRSIQMPYPLAASPHPSPSATPSPNGRGLVPDATQPTAFSSFHNGKSFSSSSSIPANLPSFSKK